MGEKPGRVFFLVSPHLSSHQHQVHRVQVHLIEKGEGGQAGQAGVDAAVEHNRLAQIAHDDAGTAHLLARAQRRDADHVGASRVVRLALGSILRTHVVARATLDATLDDRSRIDPEGVK